MKVLGIDASTEVLSVCAIHDEKRFEILRDIDLRHSEQLLSLIDFVLNQLSLRTCDLDLIVTARGPGSFTGLRIGMATVKGLSAGTDVPYVSVPSLDVYAGRFGFREMGHIAPVIDAKKNKFYTAIYFGGSRLTEYLDIDAGAFQGISEAYPSVLLCGPHAEKLKGFLPEDRYLLDPFAASGAGAVLVDLGIRKFKASGADEPNAGPLYIRESDAELSLRGKTND